MLHKVNVMVRHVQVEVLVVGILIAEELEGMIGVGTLVELCDIIEQESIESLRDEVAESKEHAMLVQTIPEWDKRPQDRLGLVNSKLPVT